MKAKAARLGKGWLDRKLVSQKFRKGFEEESQKLAIGEQLSRLRQEAGLTQAQVAKRTGTTATRIAMAISRMNAIAAPLSPGSVAM